MADNNNLVSALNLAFLEGLYAEFQRDPESVPSYWRRRFESLAPGERPDPGWRLGPSFPRSSIFNPGNGGRSSVSLPPPTAGVELLQDRVDQLIRNYRVRGHMVAAIDPLELPRPPQPELDPGFYGFGEADMDREFSSDTMPGAKVRTLRGIIEHLRNTYCRSIGVQFYHIDDLSIRRWLQDRMEANENRLNLSRQEQLRILTRLTDAVIFEEFIQKKFLGAKSFSLEGAESLIPLVDLAIDYAGEERIDEIVLGMAHRGRLNVLANVMGKSAQEIFREFEDADPKLKVGSGDVKYHQGHSADWVALNGHKIHLSLSFNPSHLEFVNPVALGRMRAKQDRVGDTDRKRGLVLLIHGDAAFAGEGIVQESLNLSELQGYTTGGAIHVIVNNQIGFTTTPEEGRSSTYATGVAKMLQSPIFHVNGEDPEAVVQVVRLAMDFRQKYKRDVFIDMYSYRRLGHNEADEPSFTQPLMYRAIQRRPSVRDGYLEHLLALGGITRDEADRIAEARRERLETALAEVRGAESKPSAEAPAGIWSGFHGGPYSEADEVETGVSTERSGKLLERTTQLPEDFRPHPKIERILKTRRDMARGERPLDWGAGEALALASIASDGYRVRLTGQDTGRGTFSHRHGVLYDYEDGHIYVPLAHVDSDQALVEIYNSPLSEAGVLGFDYGYSLDYPDALVMWEAQFGDFANAAQVIFDQFIASAEDKWRRLSGIVMLLPHGFEGMGPEHSSARLERFLQLGAEDNIQVVYPTTPAQYFHCLRRQVLRRWRKPLVVMTPKSLLRLPEATSRLEDFEAKSFQNVIPDSRVTGAADVERVLLCTGKMYYDLDAERKKRERSDVAIVRLEQLYPFPSAELKSALTNYPGHAPILWVQEEPKNMGAWSYLRMAYGDAFDAPPPKGIFRQASASPATGSAASHRLEQQWLLDAAFGDAT